MQCSERVNEIMQAVAGPEVMKARRATVQSSRAISYHLNHPGRWTVKIAVVKSRIEVDNKFIE